jgi:hypothetical protein
LSGEAFDTSVKQVPPSSPTLRCQDLNEAELVLYSFSNDASEVRVEEHEFSDSEDVSNSEDEREPTFIPGLLEQVTQSFVGFSLALPPSAPKLEARPDPDLSLSDVPPFNAPRSTLRRLSIRSWSAAALLYQETAKKVCTLSPSQSNVTEEKTFRPQTQVPVTRASIKRSRPTD